MNNTYRYTIIPVILGANLRARIWADKILWRFRVRSYVMSEAYHPALLLTPSIRFRTLKGNRSYSAFVVSDLIRFAQDHPDKLLVLMGTTSYYNSLIREHSETLDRYYIRSDADLSFLVREEPEEICYLKGGRT